MIAGVLLTAGESSRMGRPKALIRYKRTTFSRSIVDAFRGAGLKNIFAVVGHEPGPVVSHLCESGVRFVYNPRWPAGQISSLQAAIRACPKSASGILVALVDQPGIRLSTVRRLAKTAGKHPGKIIVGSYKGQRGHPVVFPKKFFRELLRAPVNRGARAVVQRHLKDRLTVSTQDSAVVRDIDTRREYQKMR